MKHEILKNERYNHCKTGLCCTVIENLNIQKGNHEILKNINLHIHCGEVTSLIGPNGAGKSTLLKAIIGENSYQGKLQFTDGENELSRKPTIGYVPQKLDFDSSSPISVLDLFASTQSNRPIYFRFSKKIRKEAIESLKKVNAEDLVDKKIGFLSGGELQRVLLALALQPVPDILLLDEPVSGIDHSGLSMFYKIVSELRENYDLSIILVSHDFDSVYKYSDRVVFLNNKTIECVGTPKEVFRSESVIETFGLRWNIDSERKGEEK